jgi:hypothetical protein
VRPFLGAQRLLYDQHDAQTTDAQPVAQAATSRT